MNATHLKCRSALGAVAIVRTLLAPVAAYTGEKLAGQAKVSIEKARAIALDAHPGAIVDEEREREAGGSGLRYAFDIKSGKVVHEVGVDAATGAVLENAPEGANPD